MVVATPGRRGLRWAFGDGARIGRGEEHAARNLAHLRKIALNIVGRDRTTKASVRARRKRAAWNDACMLKLLVG